MFRSPGYLASGFTRNSAYFEELGGEGSGRRESWAKAEELGRQVQIPQDGSMFSTDLVEGYRGEGGRKLALLELPSTAWGVVLVWTLTLFVCVWRNA